MDQANKGQLVIYTWINFLVRAGTRDVPFLYHSEEKHPGLSLSLQTSCKPKSDVLGNGVLAEVCSSGHQIKNGIRKEADKYWPWNRTDSSEPLSYSKHAMSYKLKPRYNPDRRLYKIPEWVSVRNSAYILIRCNASGLISTFLQLPFEKIVLGLQDTGHGSAIALVKQSTNLICDENQPKTLQWESHL